MPKACKMITPQAMKQILGAYCDSGGSIMPPPERYYCIDENCTDEPLFALDNTQGTMLTAYFDRPEKVRAWFKSKKE
jgi:uncharacterized OB-fold protein